MSIADSLAELFARIEAIGRTEQGGYRRFALTPEDEELRDFFAAEVTSRGLRYEVDTAGNQWGWWQEGDGPAVVTGSHLDSVPDGGAFDGPLGVLSALLAIDELRSRGITPRRPIAVVNFTEEEGGRFPLACRGSRVLTGAVDAETVGELKDPAGTRLADALDGAELAADPELVSRIGAYVELHIEQGRNLATMGDQAIAVASAIWPHGRWRLQLSGVADHAGTTRLADRDDALIKAARIILAVREAAEETGTLATVGALDVSPGAINAIPSGVELFIDARAETMAKLDDVIARITQAASSEGGDVHRISLTPETSFHPGLSHALAERCHAPLLATGAGHDAGILADAGVPATMLFVRNPTGVSHSPHEHAELTDCEAGVLALADCLEFLATAEQLP